MAAAQGYTLDSQLEAQESAVLQLEELATSGGILSRTLSILVEGVAALQSDVNENIGQIEQIAGQADAAIIRSLALESQLATLDVMASEPGKEVRELETLNGSAGPTNVGGGVTGESETGGTPTAVLGTPEASPTPDE